MNKTSAKEKASERAHQDGSSPFRSMATKTGVAVVAMRRGQMEKGRSSGNIWGSAIGKGKEGLVRRREPKANVSRGSSSYDRDGLSPGGHVREGPFLSFLGLPAVSGERSTTNFGVCALDR